MSAIPLGQVENESQIDRAELLRGIPLFAGLSEERLQALGQVARVCEYPESSEIITEGELPEPTNDGMYLLINGAVAVRKNATEADNGELLARLGPGEFFGEMALLDGFPRSASVFATAEVLCLILNRDDLHRTLRSDPEIALRMLAVLSQRLRTSDRQS